jgi:hypothetical protein
MGRACQHNRPRLSRLSRESTNHFISDAQLATGNRVARSDHNFSRVRLNARRAESAQDAIKMPVPYGRGFLPFADRPGSGLIALPRVSSFGVASTRFFRPRVQNR